MTIVLAFWVLCCVWIGTGCLPRKLAKPGSETLCHRSKTENQTTALPKETAKTPIIDEATLLMLLAR